MIYILIYLLLLAAVYHYDIQGHTKNKIIVFYSILFIFILLSGLRYNVGTDNIRYAYSWKYYPSFFSNNFQQEIDQFLSISNFERFKKGWIIYAVTVKTIFKDFIFLQILNAILLNLAIFKTIKRYSKLLFMPILVYASTFTFVEFEFELMREIVAISIFLIWGLDAFVKKKWIRYYLVILIAYNFHPSAMIMFALPFVRNLKWKTWKYIIFFIIPSITLALIGKILIGNVINIFLGDQSYASSYYGDGGDNNFNYFLMYAFKPSALLALYLCFKKHINIQDWIIPVYFFSLFFLYLSGLAYTAARFVNYIIILDFILISQIFYFLYKKFHSFIPIILIFLLYNLPSIYQYKEPITVARHYPYRSIFNPEPTTIQRQMEQESLKDY